MTTAALVRSESLCIGRFKIIKACGACVVLVFVTGLELSCQRCGFLRRMDILLLPGGGCYVVS
jgi:hypothetical protein